MSYFLYYNKTWAAGDAKLYLTILFLMPYDFWGDNSLNIFPGFVILALIFGISFLFIMVESLILVINDLVGKSLGEIGPFKFLNLAFLKKLLINYVFSFLMCSIVTEILIYLKSGLYENSRGLFMLLNVFLISITLNFLNKFKNLVIYMIIVMIPIDIFIKLSVIHLASSISISINSLVILLIIILLRYLGSRYNYKIITTEEVQEGMVLSFDTLLKFKNSKIKDLPLFTTENTDTRLTLGEVMSIQRWGKTKKENAKIRIVRHMPFAPFIAVGTFMFISVKIYFIFIR